MNVAWTKRLALSLPLTLALASGTFAHAGSITNGNFSTSGPIPGGYEYLSGLNSGWNFSGGAGIQENGSAWNFAPAPGAGQSAFLQSYNGSANVGKGNPTSSISQDVAGLTNGQEYTVSFDLANRPGYGSQAVTVTIDGFTFTITPSSNNWTEYSESFVYNGGSDTLTFSVTDPTDVDGTYDYDTGLGDVGIAATPEPGTLLLLGSGLLGFAGLARRKFGTKNA